MKRRWLSPINIDKISLFDHGEEYDIKARELRGIPYVLINGVGLFESDFVGNVFYGSVMSNFQSITESLTDGDFLQNLGVDDVFDSFGIILGHKYGSRAITRTTFESISNIQLYKETFIHGKAYSTYTVNERVNGQWQESEHKTNH